MRTPRVLLLLTALPALACGCGFVAGVAGPTSLPPEYDLYEAVVRHEAARPQPDTARGGPVFYVSISGKDPPAAFLRRLRDLPGRVEPGSRGRAPGPYPSAVVISIREEVTWVDGDTARVMLLAFPASEPPRCGTPYPCVVVRRDGRWVVRER